MKTVIVVCLVFAGAIAFPAVPDDDSNESEFFGPLNKKVDPTEVEVDGGDSDEGSFFFSSFFRPVNPISTFRPVGKVPSPWFSWNRPTSWYDWDLDFSNLFSIFDSIGQPPQGSKANSTSTVKVVNGERITVNTTTYVNGGSVQRIKIVEIVPVNPQGTGAGEGESEVTTSEEVGVTQPSSPESTSPKDDSNDSLGNEIIEVQREELNRNNGEFEELGPTTQPVYDKCNRLQSNYIDLSNDTRVNEIAEAAAIKSGNPFRLPPDVEVFHNPLPNSQFPLNRLTTYQYRYDGPPNWRYLPFGHSYRSHPFHYSPYINNVRYRNSERSYYFNNKQFLSFN